MTNIENLESIKQQILDNSTDYDKINCLLSDAVEILDESQKSSNVTKEMVKLSLEIVLVVLENFHESLVSYFNNRELNKSTK